MLLGLYCTSYFFFCCDRMSDEKDLYKEEFTCAHSFGVQSVLHDREGDEASYIVSVIKKSREINIDTQCPFSYK